MEAEKLDRLASDLDELQAALENDGQSTRALTVGRALEALDSLREGPSEPQLAKVIRVERGAGAVSLSIDGRAFPWYVHADGVRVGHITRDDAPRVHVPIIAERLEVVDALDPMPGATYETTGGDTVRVEEDPSVGSGFANIGESADPPGGPPVRPDVPDDRPVA